MIDEESKATDRREMSSPTTTLPKKYILILPKKQTGRHGHR